MKQTLYSNAQTSVWYNPLSGVSGGSGNETDCRCPIAAAGTIRNFQVRLSTALVGAATRTFTVRKNGVDTALTFTMTSASIDGADTSNSVSVSAGDTLGVHHTSTGSPPAITIYSRLEFEATNPDTTVYGSGGITQYGAGTVHSPLLCGQSGANGSSQAINESIASVDGTITDLYVRVTVSPGAGKSRTFVIYKNGVAQDGSGGTPNTTVTITTGTQGNTSFSLSVLTGDLLALQATSAGAPTNSGVTHCVAFVASVAGWQHVTMTDLTGLTNSSTRYNVAHGGHRVWQTTQSPALHVGGVEPLVLGQIHARVAVAPGSGKSWAFTLQVNGSDTALTCTIANAATQATFTGPDLVTITDGDSFNVSYVPSGTPTGSTAKVTFLQTALSPVNEVQYWSSP